MRKISVLLVSATILLGFGLFVSSCDDDEPPVPPKLSFALKTVTALESDGNLLIEVVLDKPASEDITIDYSLGGTAIDVVTAGNTADPDYEIIGDYLEVEIEEGETKGIIEIDLFSDGLLEDDETIEISIEDVDSDEIEITRDDEIVITITQEDGLIILLEWPAPTVDKTADMDIILRAGQNTSTWDGILNLSADGSFQGPEFVFVPKTATFPAYGLSYVYYEGNVDPLTFTATFIDFANGTAEAVATRESFQATYTAVNKNPWTAATINSTIVVQTFLKTGGAFTSPTVITVPGTGSRIGSSDNFKSPFEFNRNSSRGNRVKQFPMVLKN